MSGLYERAMAQHVLEARRHRYLRRLRVLLVVFAVSTVVFFALLVR